MLNILDNIQKSKCSFAKYQNISRYYTITIFISNNNKIYSRKVKMLL